MTINIYRLIYLALSDNYKLFKAGNKVVRPSSIPNKYKKATGTIILIDISFKIKGGCTESNGIYIKQKVK